MKAKAEDSHARRKQQKRLEKEKQMQQEEQALKKQITEKEGQLQEAHKAGDKQRVEELMHDIKRKSKTIKQYQKSHRDEEAAASKAKPKENPDQYKVCQFQLHEFDLSGEVTKPEPDEVLARDPLVAELHESFCGYFTLQECSTALLVCNQDMPASASWLVEEAEKDRGKLCIGLKKTVLLGESLVVQEQKNNRNEFEVEVQGHSLLTPSVIASGRWTMNKDVITL